MQIVKYKAVNKGPIIASLDVKIEKWGNLIIREMLYFSSNGKRWVNFPSKQYEDKEKKKKFYSYVIFEDPKMNSAFSEMILKEIDAYLASHMVPQPTLSTYTQQEIPF